MCWHGVELMSYPSLFPEFYRHMVDCVDDDTEVPNTKAQDKVKAI